MPRVSLVTFTYNDGELVRGLLESVSGWSLQPMEIVVVDDGSDEPFAAPSLPLECSSGGARTCIRTPRVIRLSPNRGILEAKRTGLDAATGDILFSVDCDMRIGPRYLEKCLHLLQTPNTGMASGGVAQGSGSSLTSRYLWAFGDNHNLDVCGPVEFIPGAAYAIPRAVWEEVGGFGGHGHPVCEDHALCRAVRAAGYELRADGSARAEQVRVLELRTLCRRVWSWCRGPVVAALPQNEQTAPYLYQMLATPLVRRLEPIMDMGEPLFTYVELLYLSYAVSDALERYPGEAGQDMLKGFHATLLASLEAHPQLLLRLADDLEKLGIPFIPPDGHSTDVLEQWEPFDALLRILGDSGLLAWLNDPGMALLRREVATPHHFSSY